MTSQYRYIRLTGLADGAQLRTALFEGREHLVVPVVALIGGEVIWAQNAPGPELVPADVIARSAIEWNGRPVVGDHPKVDGAAVSANDPEICERHSFGRVANPRFERNRLLLDAWLDSEKAEKVGDDAVDVINRANKGEVIEVSAGAWVEVDHIEGVAENGKKYVGIWRDIGSDHLSMLPREATGACSVDMGCGAPRIANKNRIPEKQLRAAIKEMPMTKPKLLQRLMSYIRAGEDDEGVSDRELREKLYAALRAVEPGFDWIVDVFPDSNTVVYTTWPENELLWFRRTFSVNDTGEVALNDDREQVEQVTRYEPITAADGSAAGECQCQHGKRGAEMSVSQKVKEAANRLIASARSPFAEEDRKYLEGLKEEKLKALEDGLKESEEKKGDEEAGNGEGTEQPNKPPTPAPVPPSPNPAPASGDAGTVQVSAQELASLRSMAAREAQREQAYRGELMKVLKGAQSEYDEAGLKALPTEQLEKMARMLKVNEEPALRSNVSYIGHALPIDREEPELPDTYGLVAAEQKRAGVGGKEVN